MSKNKNGGCSVGTGVNKFITSRKVYCKSVACVISIIINALAVSCTPKQIDLQAFFVITAALLCQCAIINKWM